jgi:hypothetical protein
MTQIPKQILNETHALADTFPKPSVSYKQHP